MSIIEIDGLNEEDFRRSIENRLREGRAEAAIARLRPLLEPYAGPDGVLPERFLTVEPKDLVLIGWDGLGDAVRRRDMPGRRVTALSIAFAWPGDEMEAPDDEGRLRPHIETGYFSDNAYPFSLSMREDLLDGYSVYGCCWSGDAEASDNALGVEGIDDLHGALARLEARLLASEEPDEHGVRAGSLGACMLSSLLVQAVSDRIARDGLPRPLCVMAGSNGVYPYFDAPVSGMSDIERKQAEADEEEAELAAANLGAPPPRYSSLLMASIPRAKKRAVLVLEHDDVSDRIAQLRHLGHGEGLEDESQREAATAGPVHIDPPVDSPLLVKKHPKKQRDLYEILGLQEPAGYAPPAPFADEPSFPREPAGFAEPEDEPLGPVSPFDSFDGFKPLGPFEQFDEPVPAGLSEPFDDLDASRPAELLEPFESIEPPEPEQPDVRAEPVLPPPHAEAPPNAEPPQAPGFSLLVPENPQWSLDLLVARQLTPIAPPRAEQLEPQPQPEAEPATPPRGALREQLMPIQAPPGPSLAARVAAWVRKQISAIRPR